MKYSRFEDVPVWQDAVVLATQIFEMTEDSVVRTKGDVANQIQRAGLSVSNNIAEGFERGTTPELITFLYYARGSAGEVRSVLAVMDRMRSLVHLKSQISNLSSRAESISRQLRGWAGSLQQSDIKGQRHLTDQTRAVYQQDKKAKEFLDQIKRVNAEAAEKRRLERERNAAADLKSEI